MRRWKKRASYATACAAILILPGACAGVSPGDFCRLYQPVYTAPADTLETQQQADANNALWLGLCDHPLDKPR